MAWPGALDRGSQSHHGRTGKSAPPRRIAAVLPASGKLRAQAPMRPAATAAVQMTAERGACVAHTGIGSQIDPLVSHTPPQPLDEHGVPPRATAAPPDAVHLDFYMSRDCSDRFGRGTPAFGAAAGRGGSVVHIPPSHTGERRSHIERCTNDPIDMPPDMRTILHASRHRQFSPQRFGWLAACEGFAGVNGTPRTAPCRICG